MRRFDQIFGLHHRDAAFLCEIIARKVGVAVRCIDASADCGCTEVNFLNQCARFSEPQHIFLDHHGVGRKLLPQRHRHRVLQLGATDFEHGFKFDRFGIKPCPQNFHRTEKAVNGHPQRKTHCGRIHVVGALRCVDVIVRVQRVVAALLQPHEFKCDVCDDFVGIHVGGGAGATLNHIDHKLVEEFSSNQRFAGFDDRLCELTVERAEFYIGAGGGFFDKAEGTNQVGHRRDHRARYREIFNRAGRMHAPIGMVGDLLFSQKIVFDTVAV